MGLHTIPQILILSPLSVIFFSVFPVPLEPDQRVPGVLGYGAV